MPRERLSELHITVAAAGVDAGLMSWRPEVRMVKAALLYADRVTLTSPKLTVQPHLAAQRPPSREFREAVKSSGITSRPGWSAAITIWDGRRRFGHIPSAQEQAILADFADELATFERLWREDVARQSSGNGSDELTLAINAGALSLEPIAGGVTDPARWADEVAEHFEDLFRASLGAETPTYPLFDLLGWLSIGGLARRLNVTPRATAPVKEVALATRLIVDELEAFPDAPMDAVLDVRAQLAEPLTRFRSALARAADELDSTGFDTAFEREAKAYYRREVAPALLELREQIRDLGARETLRRGQEWGAATLGLAAAGAASIKALLGAAAISAGAGTKQEIKYRREAHREHRENSYFFLWRADELLASRPRSG